MLLFFKKRQQNLFRDPFVALAPWFAPFALLTTQTSTPLLSAQDDTKRGKMIEFVCFFRTVEDAGPYNLWIFCFLWSNALCAQKPSVGSFLSHFFSKKWQKQNPIVYHHTTPERTMCVKTFPYESFWRYLFSKR